MSSNAHRDTAQMHVQIRLYNVRLSARIQENCLQDLPFHLHRILWTHMEYGRPPDMVSFDYDICCSNFLSFPESVLWPAVLSFLQT